jgi:hypothetical protein
LVFELKNQGEQVRIQGKQVRNQGKQIQIQIKQRVDERFNSAINLLDDKQKREIISYAKENPKLTQQQIANNLTIKWDLFILMSLYKTNGGI